MIPSNGLIVADWIEARGGAERVVAAMHEAFPDAPIAALWAEENDGLQSAAILESPLARSPLRGRKALALPFMPAVWRSWRPLKRMDWVLASSHAFAHHVAPRGATKLAYVHTPARYLWFPEDDRRGGGFAARVGSPPLRRLDRWRAREADAIAANSAFVQRRIEQAWGRPSTVIYPPVDVDAVRDRAAWMSALTEFERQQLDRLANTGFVLGVSRFVRYKELDKVILAGEASGLPVVLAGRGPDVQRLETLAADASVPVTVLVSPSDAMIRGLLTRATVFVFPALEDFGIVPVEAMAAGTPVISRNIGGAAESVVHGASGIHIEDFTMSTLRSAVTAASALLPDQISARADSFSNGVFLDRLRSWVEESTR